MAATTSSDLLLPPVSESKPAPVTGIPPPRYEEEKSTHRHVLPVSRSGSELASGPAFEQMVDTRLQHLEAHLARIEAVLLDLQDQSRTSNQAPDGRRSLRHLYRQARLALRQRKKAWLDVIAPWASKQCLRSAISCYDVSSAIYRSSGDTLKADRVANKAEELRERLRTRPPALLWA